MIRVYSFKPGKRYRIRSFLAGIAFGLLVAAAAVYAADGPLYTTSEIDGILAANLTQGE